MKQHTVSFVTRILTHYRVPFHEMARDFLAEQDIRYRLFYGQPNSHEAEKSDLAHIDWAEKTHNYSFGGFEKLVWQPVITKVRHDDLVVIGQENQLLVNYPILALSGLNHSKVAFFGHGRNFQSRNRRSVSERWKAFWATKPDWWFGYTDETRRHIETLGFPSDRITVFNNAIDTRSLAKDAASVNMNDLSSLRTELGLQGGNIAIFVGGVYAEKRVEFLVEAAEIVRAKMTDFELVVVGGGVDLPKLRALAADKPWIKIAGPRFGVQKAALMQMAKLFLMPGLVGLAVLDAGTMGLPIVTTRYPWHSPEIAYLKDGVNGIIVAEWENEVAYAKAVMELLVDEGRWLAMSAAARMMASERTIEDMARRFSDGVLKALAT